MPAPSPIRPADTPIDDTAVVADQPETVQLVDEQATEPRRDGGYVLMLTALLILPIVAFTGFAVDLGAWNARASQIQSASDAAALSGVTYLPNVSRATTEARRVAAMNGFEHGVDGIEVTVQDLGNARLEVRIRDTGVDQFFTSYFTDQVTIARGATAEFIRPVPLGSPRNFLGTGTLVTGEARELLWLSVSGYCARREHGDRLTPFAAANHGVGVTGGFKDCLGHSGGGNNTIDNPEFTPDGYFYAIELDDGDENAGETWGSPLHIDVFDAPHCQGAASGANDSGSTNLASERRYHFRLRSNTGFDPFTAPVLAETIVSPADCGALAGNWHRMFTVGNPTEGVYYLQITPIEPVSKTLDEGQNQFALRAVTSEMGGWRCTADPAVATSDDSAPAFTVGGLNRCPRVYALTHLGVYAFVAGTPEFFLAQIGPQYEGRRLQVELFDSGENAEWLELLDPMGNVVTDVSVEIGCYNGQFRSEIGGNCPAIGGFSEAAPPPPGWGPFTPPAGRLDVSGNFAANRPWGTGNSQQQRYNDRIVRLTYDLPSVEDSPGTGWFDGNEWFKLRYRAGVGVGDRTTWTIQVLGDPVRLVD